MCCGIALQCRRVLLCGFAVGCEDSEDTGFCPLRIMWCAPEHLCKQHIILMDRAIDLPLCTC